MSRYQERGNAFAQQNANISDYKTNNCYNANDLVDHKGNAISYYGTVKPGVQIVPTFKNVSYVNPNYDSLTQGACSNSYPTINSGYVDGNCVKYVGRQCPKSVGSCQ